MTNDEKTELITRLRDLALKLEHNIPLQHRYTGDVWRCLADSSLSSTLRVLRQIRPKPVPMEEWKAVYKGNYIVSSNSKESAEKYVEQYPVGFVRIVHMREVME